MKKVLSLFIAVAMIISAMASVTAFAATEEVYKLDLSTYTGNIVEEGGITAAVIGKNGDKITIGEEEKTLSNAIAVKNDAGVLPAGTQGIVINTTFKLSSTAAQIILLPTTGVYPRYADLSGGTIKYNGNGSVGQINTEQSIAANVWYDMTFMLNYKTGYLKVISTNLSTGAVRTHTKTDADFILTDEQIAAIKTVRWWHTGNQSSTMYISKYEVYAEDDVDAIAPSKTIVRDDFDSSSATVSAPWTSTSTEVVATDKGQSVILGKDHSQYLYIKGTNPIVPAAAKGFVSEFSVKLTGTQKHGFIYALNDSSNNYWSAALNLIKFDQRGNIQVNGQKANIGTWAKDRWYGIRIEYNFVDKTIRYIVNYGSGELVGVYKNDFTVYDAENLAKKVQLQFISEDQNVDQNILIDDVNIFWLDELGASGITEGKDKVSLTRDFEGLAEGKDALANDMACGAPNSLLISGTTSVADCSIVSVPNSGRGKSFKATATFESDKNVDFYKDFSAIQNGVVEFDIMFETTKGLTIINAQTSNASNGDMSKGAVFRFDNWGNIKDAGNKEVLGSYNAGIWYKVVLTAVVNDGISGVKYQVYSPTALVAEGVTTTGNTEICRDSIRYAMLSMHTFSNTIYVDNYKAYAPSEVPYGIYPVGEAYVKNSTLTPENQIKLNFSKMVDISKSKFTINGEEVSASGTEMVTLNKVLEAGETYDVEYTVYDLNGYKAMGYVNNISVEDVYNISDYSKATLDNPAASVNVRIGNGAAAKDVALVVAAYNGNKMLSVDVRRKTVGSEAETFNATVDADGADSVKTFLWNLENLTALK